MSVDPFLYSYVASEETYPDKGVIIEEGSKGFWVYVILEGQAKVTQKAPKGLVIVDTLREGDVFGELVMFEKGEGIRSASVTASGQVRVGILDTERLSSEYDVLSPQLKELISALISRLKDMTRRASALSLQKR
ncbi:MAG: cyclic nucleotide-binding domain-containing protein [Deltaproteobacteria bacterium]|nr:cyclic nucleotide-binding domain-containing protein [Deltaproteobacteria bacterium]MBW2052122.1 cyclic nucleotide-binding domain-containing protein [Deltaproteobacteria bacterium]MBW2141945.1 cyclic nucleotide-binding domain-containing protein [Deltaproteobacteria bacterium]MBW2324542.1 cyclic nucleotide-binding domain-containing protein [Deltaproteobacteria bacterium]